MIFVAQACAVNPRNAPFALVKRFAHAVQSMHERCDKTDAGFIGELAKKAHGMRAA